MDCFSAGCDLCSWGLMYVFSEPDGVNSCPCPIAPPV